MAKDPAVWMTGEKQSGGVRVRRILRLRLRMTDCAQDDNREGDVYTRFFASLRMTDYSQDDILCSE
jgi:hypothetical protein